MSQSERINKIGRKQNLRIKVSSYNPKTLHSFIKYFKNSAKSFWFDSSGPFPLPTKNDRYTVPTSPHVYKTAQEHFEKRTHSVLIVIKNPNSDAVKAISEISIPDDIQIKIQLQND